MGKLENVIVDHTGYGKLCDMGFARLVLGTSKTLVGTAEYMAPEMIDRPHAHDTAVDWWGLGVLTFELFAGQVPWHVPDTDDAWDRIQAIRMSHPDHTPLPFDYMANRAPAADGCSCLDGAAVAGNKWWQVEVSMGAAQKFMKKLLEVKKANRLGNNREDSVRKDRFFSGFKFECLEAKMLPSPYEPPELKVDTAVKPPRPLTGSFEDVCENDLFESFVDDGSAWDDA